MHARSEVARQSKCLAYLNVTDFSAVNSDGDDSFYLRSCLITASESDGIDRITKHHLLEIGGEDRLTIADREGQ